MEGVPDEIKRRHVANCMQADSEYGRGVAAALDINEKKNC
jgi:catalase